MRIAAIIFITLSLVANFYYNNLTSLVAAMFSFPVLIWVLVKRRKKVGKVETGAHHQHPENASH